VESEKKIALLDLAASVAHDIRSPLAAMEMILRLISKDIPTAQCSLLCDAIQSVRDISNNLLVRYREPERKLNLDKNKKGKFMMTEIYRDSYYYQRSSTQSFHKSAWNGKIIHLIFRLTLHPIQN